MYCRRHAANNCIECAIEKQTASIVRAINELKPPAQRPSMLKTLLRKFRVLSSPN